MSLAAPPYQVTVVQSHSCVKPFSPHLLPLISPLSPHFIHPSPSPFLLKKKTPPSRLGSTFCITLCCHPRSSLFRPYPHPSSPFLFSPHEVYRSYSLSFDILPVPFPCILLYHAAFGCAFALALGTAAAADFEPLLELRLLPLPGWASLWHYTALTCFLRFAKPRNTERTLSEPACFTFHLFASMLLVFFAIVTTMPCHSSLRDFCWAS